MILRLSQKLNTKVKAGKLAEALLDENPYADWSCHLFTASRNQYIILTNTPSLYSCVMLGRGITSVDILVQRALDTIRDFTADDGKQLIYRKFIAPAWSNAVFAKALNRSVNGSMNDHIQCAKIYLADGVEPSEIGYEMNKTPMSALAGVDGRKYGFPRDVFERLT